MRIIMTLKTSTLFALVAVFLAMLGLIAMSTWFAVRNSKDIAIRKVFGSEMKGETLRTIRSYMVLILVAIAVGIPVSILPEPVPSSKIYGRVAKGILGLEALEGIPISGAIGDQPAALFGQACFEPGQAKNTYGTGCFLLMNTGEKRVQSNNNLLTGVAWGIGDKVEYSIEGSAFNAGSVIKWLRDELHLIDSARRCDELAESVPDANGIYFVPAFTGLGAPYWDMYARGAIVGLTRGVNRAHVARSVLEAICYQMTDLLEAMKADSGIDFTELRVDGGASVSDIMLQIQADMIQCSVNRPKTVETTALGAAYLAGLAVGFWESKEEIPGGSSAVRGVYERRPVRESY